MYKTIYYGIILNIKNAEDLIMKKFEICRYDNRLNSLSLPNITESELNLFFNLIQKMRHKKQGEVVRFEAHEISKMIGEYKKNNEKLLDITERLFEKLFKADYKVLLKHGDFIGKRRVNLFKIMDIFYFVENKEIAHIDLEVNEHFEHILGELLENYTEFELVEFVNISGKYTKLLYIKLKQFRTTGNFIIEWEKFKNELDFPKALKPSDIDKILKQAIKELTLERTLFDQKRIPFKNLTYRKLTKSGEPNRRKLTPYFIEFTFTPQDSTKTLKDQLQGIRWIYNDEIYQVANIERKNGKIVARCFVLDRESLQVKGNLRNLNFQNYEHAENIIKENMIID